SRCSRRRRKQLRAQPSGQPPSGPRPPSARPPGPPHRRRGRRWGFGPRKHCRKSVMRPLAQAHIMADTESLGEPGVCWLEGLAALPKDQRQVRIPTTTDPRGLDFASYKRLKQTDAMAAIEARAIAAFEALGVLMTNTCINYQTILPPVRGEHSAFGDTGVVIYANSVMGARSNFEGGPSALSA